MIKLEKYTGAKTYMTPIGTLATPESVAAETPAVAHFTFVVETDPRGEVMRSFENLSVLRGINNLDEALTDDEAIAAIEAIRNAPPPEPEPSAEERIAAAMEYQNLMSM